MAAIQGAKLQQLAWRRLAAGRLSLDPGDDDTLDEVALQEEED